MKRKSLYPFSPTEEKKIMRVYTDAAKAREWEKHKFDNTKFCLRCGGGLALKFVEAENTRRLVCGACTFITYQNPHIVAATLPVRNGKIYLLRRNIEPALGLWTFPAGYMELGETVAEAALRETWEEIRAKAHLEGLQGIYSYPNSSIVNIVYRARVVGPAPRPGIESQCVEAFRPSDIPWNELAFRSTFHALKDWVQGLSGSLSKAR